VVVSGGGKRGNLDAQGGFVLVNVEPSTMFRLEFGRPGAQPAAVGIGNVESGAIVRVRDIRINSDSGSVTTGSIISEPAAPGADSGYSSDSFSSEDSNSDNCASGHEGGEMDEEDEADEEDDGTSDKH
jgi:hypothetical protein